MEGDTSIATKVGTPEDPCDFVKAGFGVWYRLKGTGNPVRFSTCDGNGGAADYDTQISVFTGSCSELACVTANDDGDGQCENGASTVDLTTTEVDQDYFILVHGLDDAFGNFTLVVIDLTADPPVNDVCGSDTAPLVTDGDVIPGTTLGATQDSSVAPSTCGNDPEIGVWYRLMGTGNVFALSLCDRDSGSAEFDTLLDVYTGSCDSGFECVVDNDDFCDEQSLVAFQTIDGEEYYILVHGFDSAQGNFNLAVVENPVFTQPNDFCVNAQEVVLGGGGVSGSTLESVSDRNNLVPSCDGTIPENGVWYMVTATEDSTYRFSLCSDDGGLADFDTLLTIYSGDCESLTCEANNDDACDTASRVDVDVTAGVDYFVLVHGFNETQGDFTLAVVPSPQVEIPSNDLCGNAIDISSINTIEGTTLGATSDQGGTVPVCDDTEPEIGVWYKLKGNGETYRLSFCPDDGGLADFDTLLTVYRGDCDSLSCEAHNDDDESCGSVPDAETSSVTFSTTADVYYFVLVHGFNGEKGDFTLAVVGSPPSGGSPPLNDLCVNATDVSGGERIDGTTVDSTSDTSLVAEICDNVPTSNEVGVWYRLIGTGNEFIVSTCNANANGIDTRISVFTGFCSVDFLTCEIADDDTCGVQSRVDFTTEEGVNYYILVHGASGEFQLELRELQKELRELQIAPGQPTVSPTFQPTEVPTTVSPTLETSPPAVSPTFQPTDVSTNVSPTLETSPPAVSPTFQPTDVSTTVSPTLETSPPAVSPTFQPTDVSTTVSPTLETSPPAVSPTFQPTDVSTTVSPTLETSPPAVSPTFQPTDVSTTVSPTLETSPPAVSPTFQPTEVPTTVSPTLETSPPAVSPTFQPTDVSTTVSPTLETSPPTVSPTFQPTDLSTTVDEDQDGVPDSDDDCLGTVVPEASIQGTLLPNHAALLDENDRENFSVGAPYSFQGYRRYKRTKQKSKDEDSSKEEKDSSKQKKKSRDSSKDSKSRQKDTKQRKLSNDIFLSSSFSSSYYYASPQSSQSFTVQQTRGCSCEQIRAACGYDPRITRNGCSPAIMNKWIHNFGGSPCF